MNGAQIGIFEQADHVSFTGFLDGKDCLRLESQVTLVLRGDFSHKSLKRQFADEKLCRLLVLSDLTEGDSTGPESVRLLDSFVSHICCLAGRLLRQLLPGSL